jgi:DNA-binding NarL/FixJ family response regulator
VVAHRLVSQRILLGNLEPMVRLGMTRVLIEGGLDVVAEDGDSSAIVAEARRLLPKAVVLGLEGGTARELRRAVRAVAPEAKVILWGRDEDEMEILDPGASAPRRVQTGVPSALVSELRADSASEGGETCRPT